MNDLVLYHNQLNGGIPASIGDLINLESFYVNDNDLNGEIPETICNLINNGSDIQIFNNQLCPPPPYPDCLEEDGVGNQNCE